MEQTDGLLAQHMCTYPYSKVICGYCISGWFKLQFGKHNILIWILTWYTWIVCQKWPFRSTANWVTIFFQRKCVSCLCMKQKCNWLCLDTCKMKCWYYRRNQKGALNQFMCNSWSCLGSTGEEKKRKSLVFYYPPPLWYFFWKDKNTVLICGHF